MNKKEIRVQVHKIALVKHKTTQYFISMSLMIYMSMTFIMYFDKFTMIANNLYKEC